MSGTPLWLTAGIAGGIIDEDFVGTLFWWNYYARNIIGGFLGGKWDDLLIMLSCQTVVWKIMDFACNVYGDVCLMTMNGGQSF